MKKIVEILMLITICCGVSASFADDPANTPIGYWKTIDDVTGKPKAIIHITQNDDHSLAGKILKIYPRPGHTQKEVCKACSGEKQNQPIVGMVILENLKPGESNQQWTKGSILDPQNGKTYNCNVQLLADGKRLNVRGYLGLSLFGRTQTWVRVDNPMKTQS